MTGPFALFSLLLLLLPLIQDDSVRYRWTYTQPFSRISKTLPVKLDSKWFTRKPDVTLDEGGFILFYFTLSPGSKKRTSTYVVHLPSRFVEFETASDLKNAVEKLNGREFKGTRVNCIAEVSALGVPEIGQESSSFRSQIQPHEDRYYRDPYRSRSPRRAYPPIDDFDRRFPPPPRPFSPRDHYRERSPIPMRRDFYDRDGFARRTPPRARLDDFPPRRPYDDLYDTRAPMPPPRFDDPYLPPRPSFGRPRTPPRSDYMPPYDRRPYW